MTPVGTRIRALREERGLSLRAFAKQASVSVGYLSKVEHGDSSPTVDMLTKLAGPLGVEPFLLIAPEEHYDAAVELARLQAAIRTTKWYTTMLADGLREHLNALTEAAGAAGRIVNDR